MNCPTCSTDNPPEAKFCQNCGTDLRVVCPNCSTPNQSSAQFCLNCGNRLAVPEKAAEQPAPAGAPRQSPPESERRVVTILFVDVKGSTSLGEQVDPEEWTEIIDGAFRRLIPAVTRYGGTVARLMGDALLALFGAPIAHEDDAYRAILSGLDLLSGHEPYRTTVLERLRSRGVVAEADDFQVRVGISTGLVVVGTVGSAEKAEYTAMGDAINLAARMEQTAAPGTIQIAHDTYRLVDARIEAEALGELAIKGKSRPVRVYRVTGLRRGAPGLNDVPGRSSPLIGRQREMALIAEKVNRLQLGAGQILCLIGEAGLGKSRLLAEAKAACAGRELLWVEAVSLSYEGELPYGLIRHLLRSVCRCMPDDPPELIREKITELLQNLSEEEQRPVGRALDILFPPGTGEAKVAISGDDWQEQLYAGAETIWRVQAGQRPVAIVLEDLHWTDSASIDLIRHLFNLTNRAAILFLCVFRPSRRSAAWGLKQAAEQEYPHRYDEIVLAPLSHEDSNRLVANLLEETELPSRVLRMILDKAEGNPFFVEEIVGELIESRVVIPGEDGGGWQLAVPIEEIQLPESLEALLVARMDRLEENARQTLQMAAVIGRSFYFRVLKMISDGIASIEDHLSTLERSGMIQESRRTPELEYMFRHVLTQEAAYNTMLRKRRAVFHQRTGEVMESLFADRLEEQAAMLAHHFHRGGNPGRALRYTILAADHAARLHANFEAISHFDRALEIAEDPSTPPEAILQAAPPENGDPRSAEAVRIRIRRGRATIYEKLGNFKDALTDLEAALEIARTTSSQRDNWQILLDLGGLWTSRDYDRAGRYYEDSLSIAREIGEPELLASSLNRVGNWHANQERAVEGLGFHLEALELMERSGDERSLANTNDLLGMANTMAGNLSSANHYYQRAIELFERLDERPGLISALTTLAYRGPAVRAVYLETELEKALGYGERALDLAREIGWRSGESYACFSLSSTLTALGEFDRALALGELALEIATEIQHRQWMAGSRVTLGYLFAELLDWEQAEEHLAEALRLGIEVGSKNWQYSSAAWLAYCLMQHGEIERAADLLDEIGRLHPSTQSVASRNTWWAAAELAIRQGRPEDALEICTRLNESEEWPDGAIVPLIWKVGAAAQAALGDRQRAVALAEAGYARCMETGDRSLGWRLAVDLGRYRLAAGDNEKAAEAFEAARGLVERLAATIGEDELRAGFSRNAQAMLRADG